jgi:ABC-type transporter Mla subunit MlaD
MANPIVQQINAELSELQKELAKFKDTVDYLNGAKAAVKDAVIKVNHSEAHFNKKVEELKSTYNSIIGLSDSVSSVMKKLDTINFPERLDNIEKTVKLTIVSLDETKKQTIGEVQKASETIIKADFDKKFKELRDVVNEAVKSSDKLAATIEKQQLGEKVTEFEKGVSKRIQESYKEIEKNTKQISADSAKSISDLNLPIRIDKLDANIAGILTAIQNLQGRLDLVERNFSDKLKDSIDKQKSALSELSKNVNSQIQSAVSAINNLEQKVLAIEKRKKTKTIITWVLLAAGFAAVILLCKK